MFISSRAASRRKRGWRVKSNNPTTPNHEPPHAHQPRRNDAAACKTSADLLALHDNLHAAEAVPEVSVGKAQHPVDVTAVVHVSDARACLGRVFAKDVKIDPSPDRKEIDQQAPVEIDELGVHVLRPSALESDLEQTGQQQHKQKKLTPSEEPQPLPQNPSEDKHAFQIGLKGKTPTLPFFAMRKGTNIEATPSAVIDSKRKNSREPSSRLPDEGSI
jgi:hypothetical protein